MRRKAIVVCEVCGGAWPSGTADFLVFHCLTFCSPDCLDDYRAADDERLTRTDMSPRPKSTASARTRPDAL